MTTRTPQSAQLIEKTLLMSFIAQRDSVTNGMPECASTSPVKGPPNPSATSRPATRTLEASLARTEDPMEEVLLTILQATVHLYLILEAADPEPAAVLALVQAPTGRAVVPVLVLAPTGKAAVLVLFQESRRRAELLRAELLGLQVVHSHASPVASQTEDIAALMLGGSWHVATDL